MESEATQLTAAMNRGFIGTQILAKLEAYQMPPIGREIHINNAEQLYKVFSTTNKNPFNDPAWKLITIGKDRGEKLPSYYIIYNFFN